MVFLKQIRTLVLKFDFHLGCGVRGIMSFLKTDNDFSKHTDRDLVRGMCETVLVHL